MPRFTFRLRLTALVLAAALAVPCAAAASPKSGRQPAGPGLWGQVWLVLTSFWGTGVTPDDGCRWDPDGRCITGSAAPVPKIILKDGCHWDQDGACAKGSAVPAPAVTRDDGCHMDPSGGCLPG